MTTRFGIVIIVLVLSVAALGFRDKTQTGDDVAPTTGTEIRPLDIVKSSVSRGLASLRAPRAGFSAGEQRRAEIRRAADDLFDVDDMARRALGQHWKGLLPREQLEFISLFRDVLTQSFVSIVQRYSDDVPSLDETVAGTFAQVRSRITPEEGSEIAIEYRLSQSGSQWMVYDVVFDGVSLVSNYRSQFNSILGTSAVTELLERMRKEQSRRSRARDSAGSAASPEPEPSVRGRLAAGLLLGAAHARWR